MGMNFDAIGVDNGYGEASWTARDAIIYALGVGAGQLDPFEELQFTTENSTGVEQQVLPAFGVVQAMTHAKRPYMGDYKLSQVLHGDQGFTVHGPLPVEGHVRASMVLAGIYDKGSGALATTRTEVRDAASNELYMTAFTGHFIRGEGGFGGEKQPVVPWERPERDPDHVLVAALRPDQPLLYRMSGDRNPLHSDPVFAQSAGFPRPIGHGMCTYGIASRLLVNALCDGDVSRVRGMYGRFSKPVMPGNQLTVKVWVVPDSERAIFQVVDDGGDVVLDRGTFDHVGTAS